MTDDEIEHQPPDFMQPEPADLDWATVLDQAWESYQRATQVHTLVAREIAAWWADTYPTFEDFAVFGRIADDMFDDIDIIRDHLADGAEFPSRGPRNVSAAQYDRALRALRAYIGLSRKENL
jgi:hypothetical protein